MIDNLGRIKHVLEDLSPNSRQLKVMKKSRNNLVFQGSKSSKKFMPFLAPSPSGIILLIIAFYCCCCFATVATLTESLINEGQNGENNAPAATSNVIDDASTTKLGQPENASPDACNSLSSCINRLVLSSMLIKEPMTYFAPPTTSTGSESSIAKFLTFDKRAPVATPSTKFNPIIFVPGDGGSQLEARLNKSSRVHYFCAQQSDWYNIWLNIHLLAPVVIDCFYDNFRLHYNPKTRLTENTPGVEIRTRNFSALDSVAYLDPMHMPKTDYFETIVSQFEKQNNLTRDIDMSGASFDFRKAPNELDEWFQNLTHLIESKYATSNYKPVTLVCHSMGCMNAVYLLNQKTEVWKEIFIKRLVALASPWAGSFKAISAMLFGDTMGIPLLDARKLRILQASWPSLMYLFPRDLAFPPNQTLVQTPDFNYTLQNLDKLFVEANMTDQREIWHITRKLAQSLRAPNVELWCLAGSEVPTPMQLTVNTPLRDALHSFKYQELMGDGDGTVNMESSEVCREWASQQEKPVYLRKFPGIDHISMARDPRPAQYIAQNILVRDLNE